jgi:uncharacterized protein (DUF342 family)
VDGRVKVYLDNSQMEAYLTVYGPANGGTPVSLEQAQAALTENGVVEGIMIEAVNQALQPDDWEKTILVARGRPAQDGVDGSIEYKFPQVNEALKPIVMEDGRVDYKTLNLFHNVVRGQLLAVRIPPQPGVPGITVRGRTLLPKGGKNVVLPRGKNTVVDESGNQLYAVVDGHVSIVDNKVTVHNVLELKGDIDLSSGNIDFVGSVAIKGNITSGFVVKASGDVQVNGTIEGALVEAGGNVLVKNGIAGGYKAFVKANGSIFAKFAENAKMESNGDVVISDAIVQCVVKANGSIRVEGKKGTIVGGMLQAGEEISARTIGSPLSPQTSLEVGINPQLREESKNINHLFLEKRKALDTVSQHLSAYQKSAINIDNLPDKRKLVIIRLLDDFKKLKEELQEIEAKKEALDSEMNRIQKGRVKVSDTVYPGVQITIGHSIYTVNDSMRMVLFALDQGDVRPGALR